MNVHALWELQQPGLSNEIVHFTGRATAHPNDDVPDAIHGMAPADRLVEIIRDRRLRAFRPYGCFGWRSVCFTEATTEGLTALIHQGRYEPWGIGFSKNTVFRAGGGPAQYVRGDDWNDLRISNLSARAKAFATRFWPGASPLPGGAALSPDVATTSQWAHEREWRLPLAGDTPEFQFQLADVRLLIIGTEDWIAHLDNVAGAGTVAQLGNAQVIVPAAPPGEGHGQPAAADDMDPWNPWGLSEEERMALGLPPFD